MINNQVIAIYFFLEDIEVKKHFNKDTDKDTGTK